MQQGSCVIPRAEKDHYSRDPGTGDDGKSNTAEEIANERPFPGVLIAADGDDARGRT
jgi:hypothetical protein